MKIQKSGPPVHKDGNSLLSVLRGLAELLGWTLLLLSVAAFLVAMYFLPVLVGFFLGDRHLFVLFLANLFTGWTGLGWVLSMIAATIGF